MATRVSSIFEQAQKEIRRLERAAKRIEKRGYVFDLPFGKTKTGKAKTRYTRKDVEYLKSLKARNLYQYATAFGMSGEEYRAAERSRASKKGAETRKQNLNKP